MQVIEISQGHAGRLWAVPAPGGVPDGNAEHGRGLLLMRALMDRVGFRLLPGSGVMVSLEKRLTFARVAEREPDRQEPGRSGSWV